MGAFYLLTVADPHLVARLLHGSWHAVVVRAASFAG